jgi:hypothetical protein
MQASLPYADFVGPEDPLLLLASTPNRIAELVRGWDTNRWSRTYASGKWTAAQLILHLAHDEIGWSNRIRLAIVVKDYIVQAYDGARWIALETPTDPEIALTSYLSLRRLNMMLYRRIPADQRAKLISHPELGEISIDWILNTLAGHDLHHFRQLQLIASQ